MTEEVKNPELNLNDLAALKNMMEIVTARGAFKANELSAAGALFDKLNAFLQAASAQQPEQEPKQGE
jgi:hypothetical protein